MSDAFSDRTSSGIWCGISNGKITRKAEPGAPGAVKVQVLDNKGNPKKDPETGEDMYRWQIQNGAVTGMLRKFKAQTDTYDGTTTMKLVVTITDKSGNLINLSIKEGTRYWSGLMASLLEVDVTKPLTFAPYDYIKKGTNERKQGMGLEQEGKQLPWTFKKDDPNGPPGWVKVKRADGTDMLIDGKQVWDKQPWIDWLNTNVLLKKNVDLVAHVGAEPAPMQRPAEDQAEVYSDANALAPLPADPFPGSDIDEDDLPF